MGIVSEYIRNLIVKQVDDNGIVVWYDPDGVYAEAVEALALPDTAVLRYAGSFVHLRWEVDQKKLMDGEEPPRLVVYVPMSQDQTHHALIELEAAGVVMQPGQQPPARHTRLAVSDRSFDFLDVLNPQLTLFGCANSEHLAYDAWNNRNLAHITNNQAGNVLLNATNEGIEVYVENLAFAQTYRAFDNTKTLHGCFYIGVVSKN